MNKKNSFSSLIFLSSIFRPCSIHLLLYHTPQFGICKNYLCAFQVLLSNSIFADHLHDLCTCHSHIIISFLIIYYFSIFLFLYSDLKHRIYFLAYTNFSLNFVNCPLTAQQAYNEELFKIFKERQLNKHFIKLQMAILAAVPKKERKIGKKLMQIRSGRKIKGGKLKVKKISLSPLTKSCSINEARSKIQEDPQLVPKSESVSLNLKYFQSYNPYTLGSINSIVFRNGRIYDLLLLKKDDFRVYRSVKCKCSKSKCSAKYCDCFANGQACGSSCSCNGCQNFVGGQGNSKLEENRFCRCQKSECQKKYCECFQRGESCSSKCQCCNCKNTSGCLSNENF